MTKQARGWSMWTILGWTSIGLFVAIYAVELLPHHGRPVTLRWIDEHLGRGGLIALNIVIVLAFLALLPYRRSTKGTWKSKGAFAAFVIALMTEMFGWPLVLFLLAAYVWLALFEERQAQEEFGAVYAEYAQHTKRFIPGLI